MFTFKIAQAQRSAVGLFEGMLGNSGVAISDSSAPSYYNPSLLNKKKVNSYTLDATTFGTSNSKSQGEETSSLALNPNYLGTVIVGNYLVHEIFFNSLMPSRTNSVANITNNNGTTAGNFQTDTNQITFGYSMAFKNIPFALSYFGELFQEKNFGFTEFTSSVDGVRRTVQLKSDRGSFGLGVSASGYYSNDNYTLGFNFKSRRLNIYNKTTGSASAYTYDPASATPYVKEDVGYESSMLPLSGHTIIIGHSFRNGDHEFLTDSNLIEQRDLIYRFKLVQTFGYRMTSDSGHQILCGINHLIGPDVKYFGQSVYYSSGYSWSTRSMRTAIGAYYYSSRLNEDISALGLTFGSEFNY